MKCPRTVRSDGTPAARSSASEDTAVELLNSVLVWCGWLAMGFVTGALVSALAIMLIEDMMSWRFDFDDDYPISPHRDN